MGLVTCRKCKKVFDFDKYMGICPKCCRYHSKTSYDDDLRYEENILSPADSSRCSYHGEHSRDEFSGHDENTHIQNHTIEHKPIQTQNNVDIERQKREIEQKLREKYANGTTSNITIPKQYNLYGNKPQMSKQEYQKLEKKKKTNIGVVVFFIYIAIQFLGCFVSLFE